MGRNRKMGLDYFPFDIDTFQDIRIRKLIKYQGGKAMTVYALLLCLIYKGGYYMMWDEELPFIISEQTGFEEAYISEVIKSCLALGLFSKELFEMEHVLSSKGIQERYRDICKQINRKCDFVEYSLISSEEKHISSEEMPINSEKIPQKKIKEKGKKEILSNESIKEKSGVRRHARKERSLLSFPYPLCRQVRERNASGILRLLVGDERLPNENEIRETAHMGALKAARHMGKQREKV